METKTRFKTHLRIKNFLLHTVFYFYYLKLKVTDRKKVS